MRVDVGLVVVLVALLKISRLSMMPVDSFVFTPQAWLSVEPIDDAAMLSTSPPISVTLKLSPFLSLTCIRYPQEWSPHLWSMQLSLSHESEGSYHQQSCGRLNQC